MNLLCCAVHTRIVISLETGVCVTVMISDNNLRNFHGGSNLLFKVKI